MEEITTIFVVGFPDDFKEREFQNMFTFCAGFEAATLKRPSADDLKVPDDGLLGVVTPISGTSRDGSEADGPTATSPGGASPSLPTVLTTAAAEETQASLLLNGSSFSARKPIIGFAKFRSRMDALEALDVLNGRKVDAERNCILKAEIAKKNLHTRRGLVSGEPTLSATGSFSSSLPYAAASIATSPLPGPPTSLGAAAFAASLSPTESSAFLQHQPPHSYLSSLAVNTSASSSSTGTPSASGRPGNEVLVRDAQGQATSAPPGHYDQYVNDTSRFAAPPSGDQLAQHAMTARSVSFSGAAGPRPDGAFPGHAAVASASFQGAQLVHRTSSTSAGIQASMERSYMTFKQRSMSEAVMQGNPTSPPGHNPMTLGSLSNVYAPGLNSGGLTSPGALMSPPPLTPRNQIPADQNPPCNTLYVGNLPPNASEEELRRLFARQRGYKRLCFRPKPGTGPMCFVEFDDVYCATRALNELYGTLLSNSVKGGIRLSYSKNPLGVRQTLPTPTQQNAPNMYNAQQGPLKVVTAFNEGGFRPGPYSATSPTNDNMFMTRSASIAGPFSAGVENTFAHRQHSFAADGNYGPAPAPGLTRPAALLYAGGDRSSMGSHANSGHSLLQALRANAPLPPNLGSIDATLVARNGMPGGSPPMSNGSQHQQQQQQQSEQGKDVNPATGAAHDNGNSMRWLMETII